MQDKNKNPITERITHEFLEQLRSQLKRGDATRIAEEVGTSMSYVVQVMGGNRGRAITSKTALAVIKAARELILKRAKAQVRDIENEVFRIHHWGMDLGNGVSEVACMELVN